MNEIIFEVPNSDNSIINQTNHYSIYNDSENGVAIYVFDSEGSTLNDMSEMVSFAGIRDANQVGAQNEQKKVIITIILKH